MQYEVLYPNDNGTVKVRMTINGNVLEQDFDWSDDSAVFDGTVKQGMAIFQHELEANAPAPIPTVTTAPVTVTELPTIPPTDFEPEAPQDPTEP